MATRESDCVAQMPCVMIQDTPIMEGRIGPTPVTITTKHSNLKRKIFIMHECRLVNVGISPAQANLGG